MTALDTGADQRVHHPALSGHARSIPASGIREIFDLAIGREDILHLEVGEPDFRTPAHIVDAAFASARAGSGYTATAGFAAVRAAAAARVARVHGVDLDPARVLLTHGAVNALSTAVGVLIEAGDEALIPDPAWPGYEMMVAAHGGAVVRYPLRASNAFLPDPDEIERLVSSRTKLVIVNTPANPAGAVLADADLERIVTIARRAGAVVVSDEVYDEMVFDGRPPQTLVRIDPEYVIGVWSCSKTYAMTGWRVGYMAVPGAFVDPVTRLQESVITSVSSVMQAAALAAFEGPQDCVAEMRDAYQHRRDLLAGLFDEAGIRYVMPGGAFYLMLSLADGADARAGALDLVKNERVAVAPGTAFGRIASNALRISLAASEETIRSAATRIADWYARTDGGVSVSGNQTR